MGTPNGARAKVYCLVFILNNDIRTGKNGKVTAKIPYKEFSQLARGAIDLINVITCYANDCMK